MVYNRRILLEMFFMTKSFLFQKKKGNDVVSIRISKYYNRGFSQLAFFFYTLNEDMTRSRHFQM